MSFGKKCGPFGFACEEHVDNDVCTKEETVDVLRKIDLCSDDPKSVYVKNAHERFRLGHPTTCCYQHVIGSEFDGKDVELKQYFICVGLGICIELSDLTTIHFFGHMFTHCTSVCLAMVNGKIHIVGDGETNVFAWGKGCGALAGGRSRWHICGACRACEVMFR